MTVKSYQRMKRFPSVGIFTQPGSVSKCLTDFAAPAMLGVDIAEMCRQLVELHLFFFRLPQRENEQGWSATQER